MIRIAAIALLTLRACTPEQKAEETPPVPMPSPDSAPAQAAAPADRIAPTVTKPALPGDVKVTALTAGARVTSPLVVEGVAINSFFFEGQFPAEIVVDGEVIAQAPAYQSGDTNWTDPGPVNFKAELIFDVTKETKAELVLSEDMPEPLTPDSDERGPARAVKIPVMLVPSK